jgi:hypothetical protein
MCQCAKLFMAMLVLRKPKSKQNLGCLLAFDTVFVVRSQQDVEILHCGCLRSNGHFFYWPAQTLLPHTSSQRLICSLAGSAREHQGTIFHPLLWSLNWCFNRCKAYTRHMGCGGPPNEWVYPFMDSYIIAVVVVCASECSQVLSFFLMNLPVTSPDEMQSGRHLSCRVFMMRIQ